MTNILTAPKLRAVKNVLDTFSKWDTAADIAPDMTCAEAEAVHALLLEFGKHQEARQWLNAHAIADRDPDSMHYKRGEAVRQRAIQPEQPVQPAEQEVEAA